jgi:hypothetical protein
MRKLALTVLLLIPGAAFAQGAFEIIPFGGYRWGGDVSAQDLDLDQTDVDLDSSGCYGLDLELALGPGLRLQLLADRQSSEFVDEDLSGRLVSLGGVDVTYYHLGLLYQWNPGRVKPYVGGSLGVGMIEPDDSQLADRDEFSAGVGGGFKVYLVDHLGIRVDLRGFWTNLDRASDDWDDCDFDDDCWDTVWDEYLFQTELTVGLVLSF